ncbi:MAG: hypothetical protein CSA44_01850 [Gammaproteobacteria bacterium]|nr:MAG: hypothetical protein CSA44_01850 [Gammaproteobacteria bacterium]
MRHISDYIPHRGKMMLINELVHADEKQAISSVTIGADDLFATKKGVPAFVGIEYIAQTVAAYSCAKDGNVGLPKVGLLLGSRRYQSEIDFFPLGVTLTITVNPLYLDDGALGVFSGNIMIKDKNVVSATLNVFQPDDIINHFTMTK